MVYDVSVLPPCLPLILPPVVARSAELVFKGIPPHSSIGQKKFHLRTYGVVPITHSGNAFQVCLSIIVTTLCLITLKQSTFSITTLEAFAALTLLNAGQNDSNANFRTEGIFYTIWSAPNFHGELSLLVKAPITI